MPNPLAEHRIDAGMPERAHPDVDPALLTFDEYRAIVDPGRKSHPSSAYDVDLGKLNYRDGGMEHLIAPERWSRVFRTVKVHGLALQVRGRPERLRYRKMLPDGEPERIDGQEMLYTDEEAQALGKPLVRWDIAVFDEDKQRVAAVEDEWGTLLVMVAREYRGFGLGPLLVRIARTLEPSRPSGGFTPGGFRNFRAVHQSFVRDALASGLYSKLVRRGSLAPARAREIVASARLDARPPPRPQRNLGAGDPKDWLLYVGEFGDFILYDRKLREALEHETDDGFMWVERMVKGFVYVSGEKWLTTRQFGGDTPDIRRFMMGCAIERARREGADLYVEPAEAPDVPSKLATLEPASNRATGFAARRVFFTGQAFDYGPMGRVEARFRRSFDRYAEFKDRLLELAHAKFRQDAP